MPGGRSGAKGGWLTNGGSVVAKYNTREDDDGARPFGLGCEGVVHVLLERLRPNDRAEPLAFISSCLDRRRKGALATILASTDASSARPGDHVMLDTEGDVSGGVADETLLREILVHASTSLRTEVSEQMSLAGTDLLVEIVRPPQPLYVFGAGYDAVTLVNLAKELAWHVTVSDARSHYAQRRRFPRADEVRVLDPGAPLAALDLPPEAVCVVMTHSAEQDRALLRDLSRVRVAYLGALGPRRRADRLLAESGTHTFACPSGLHSPIGLDLGGDSPTEIALAILAEIQATLSGRDARSLRDRVGVSIHERATPALALAAGEHK
jgi:xanthine/CO dehydrogenase XdhC/CoxF family maturation factor